MASMPQACSNRVAGSRPRSIAVTRPSAASVVAHVRQKIVNANTNRIMFPHSYFLKP
jgi:hypothetical protein